MPTPPSGSEPVLLLLFVQMLKAIRVKTWHVVTQRVSSSRSADKSPAVPTSRKQAREGLLPGAFGSSPEKVIEALPKKGDACPSMVAKHRVESKTSSKTQIARQRFSSPQNENGQVPGEVVPDPMDMSLDKAEAAMVAKELKQLLLDAVPLSCNLPRATLPNYDNIPGNLMLSSLGMKLGERVLLDDMKVRSTCSAQAFTERLKSNFHHESKDSKSQSLFYRRQLEMVILAFVFSHPNATNSVRMPLSGLLSPEHFAW